MHWHLHLKSAALVAVLFALFGLTGPDAHAQQCEPKPPDPVKPTHDSLSDTRLLRRIVLGLTGTTPTVEQYEAMGAATPEARATLLQAALDEALASPKFYERMLRFGHEWIAVGAYTTGANGDAYQGDMSGHLHRCDDGSLHPGAYYSVSEFLVTGPEEPVLGQGRRRRSRRARGALRRALVGPWDHGPGAGQGRLRRQAGHGLLHREGLRLRRRLRWLL